MTRAMRPPSIRRFVTCGRWVAGQAPKSSEMAAPPPLGLMVNGVVDQGAQRLQLGDGVVQCMERVTDVRLANVKVAA